MRMEKMEKTIKLWKLAFVKVNSSRSSTFSIPSGVPQGSVLGPLIFVLYINDLCHRFSSGRLCFADDLKIFRVINSTLDCVALQDDIDSLLQWCIENGMTLNIGKCKVITFCRSLSSINYTYAINGTTLERVGSIRDLGVVIDSKLRFNEHITVITAKAFSVLGFIRRNASQFTDVYALKASFVLCPCAQCFRVCCSCMGSIPHIPNDSDRTSTKIIYPFCSSPPTLERSNQPTGLSRTLSASGSGATFKQKAKASKTTCTRYPDE